MGGEDNTERPEKKRDREKKQESSRVKGVIALRGELEPSLGKGHVKQFSTATLFQSFTGGFTDENVTWGRFFAVT